MRLNSLQSGKSNLKQACGGIAEIDDHKKEGRERVDAEMRASHRSSIGKMTEFRSC